MANRVSIEYRSTYVFGSSRPAILIILVHQMAERTEISCRNPQTAGVKYGGPHNYDLSGEWARADFDERNRFSMLGTITARNYFKLGVSVSLFSGQPYNMLASLQSWTPNPPPLTYAAHPGSTPPLPPPVPSRADFAPVVLQADIVSPALRSRRVPRPRFVLPLGWWLS